MSYIEMDHAAWVRANTRPRQTLSQLGAKVANIIGIVGGGIYNAPIKVNRVDWSDGYMISVVWRGEMATFDFNQLTWLTLLCHAARIRCSVEGCGPGMLKLGFWQRKPDGGISKRHPSPAEALADFDAALPPDHSVRYHGEEPESP